jgi:hypothetical protein
VVVRHGERVRLRAVCGNGPVGQVVAAMAPCRFARDARDDALRWGRGVRVDEECAYRTQTPMNRMLFTPNNGERAGISASMERI